jgi:hypothetical protein
VDSCDLAKTYNGPDDATASVSGSCRDKAGNAGGASFGLKYDATAPATTATPSRQPNANGWFNALVSVGFTATDAISTVDSCDLAKSYSGPDIASTTLSGSCRDKAGNASSASYILRYDATPPAATATPSRQPNANGWFNAPVSASFAATDAMSTVDACDLAKIYNGPDAVSTAVGGTCRDKAGNSGSASYPVKYDATPPVTTATPSRQPNANGWYRASVDVSFAATDATSTVDSCDLKKTYSGPDTASTAVSGACRDKAGNSGGASYPVKFDATAPVATATPSRQPNANGWYNAALSVSFAATDALSGFDSCPIAQNYTGPDSVSAVVSGTCLDKAGNGTLASLALKYDATAPVTTATPSRQPNANGWFNAAVDVSFAATDVTSTVDSCDLKKTYSGPDTTSTPVAGACRDRAGNSAGASYPVKYDATAPVTTATPSRQPNANGWFNAAVDVSFAATDVTSTVDSCDPKKTYSGPDTGSTAVTGACRDKAGNSGSASYPVKFDATPPVATATSSRKPNAHGWFNAPVTVNFAATDVTSGPPSCPEAQTYTGPDSAAAVVSGTCVDNAGNGALASLALRYDVTAPQTNASARSPDRNDWYSRPLTVSFAGVDVISGVDGCTAARDYAGPDTAGVSFAGSCRDRAGNEGAEATFGFKYDGTAPVITNANAVRGPDRDGWYNRPVAFAVQGTDAFSGIDSCPSINYDGPDAAAASVRAACIDKAGNEGTRSFPLAYDATGPQVTAAPSREPGANGWYNEPVTVTYSGADPVSGLESCTSPESYNGPDSALVVIAGFCLDRAGNAGVASLPVPFDATPPQVTGAKPDRGPDSNGWYNHPLAVEFEGSDATSGIDACGKASYAGPDTGSAALTGSCRDRAGNRSDAASFTLRYDTAPPSLTAVRAKALNRGAALSWVASDDAILVEVLRSDRMVYRGSGRAFTDTKLENGARYRYTVRAYDEAGNAATAAVAVTPTAPLVSPAAGATVKAPVRLAWAAVEKATHYNVQVWRHGRIFSAWPKRTSIRVPHSWTYRGRRYKLSPGRYRWFVWPGYRRGARKTYGPLLGSSFFVVKATRR